MINKKMQEGFTILEMMIVLSIVALLFLLTLPNIQQKEEIIEEKGCEALTAVVDAQILLYEIDTLRTPTSIEQLIAGGYLKESQKRCPDGRSIVIVDGQAYARQKCGVYDGGDVSGAGDRDDPAGGVLPAGAIYDTDAAHIDASSAELHRNRAERSGGSGSGAHRAHTGQSGDQ